MIKILTGAHTRVKILKSCQNIDDWSKYIKQIWSVNILSQCIFWQKKKISHTRSKIQSKFWCQFFASIYWRIFWSCMGPFKLEFDDRKADFLYLIKILLSFRCEYFVFESLSWFTHIAHDLLTSTNYTTSCNANNDTFACISSFILCKLILLSKGLKIPLLHEH